MPNQQIKCPLCDGKKTDAFVNLGDSQIIRCKDCQNAWTSPPPPDVDYTEEDFHGNQFSDADMAEKLKSLPWMWQESIRMQTSLLSANLREGASVLEIGCGEGLLLSQLEKRGFKTLGIEPGVVASRRARAAGLNVTTGYFGQVEVGECYDAVVMSHVLEHVADPIKFLSDIRDKHPLAKVLLVQTNYRGLIPRLLKARWYAWAINQHFWHFSLRGLHLIGDKAGYSVDTSEYSTLCHAGRTGAFLVKCSKILPKGQDQFHLLLQPKS